MQPKDLTDRLLYRDALMLVLDKPAGLAVHKGPKGGDNLEAHFDSLRFGLPRPPALAHRLDRDTAGCLILGRHRKALHKLGSLFKTGRIGKTYWAVARGRPDTNEGVIDLPLGRLDATRGWWMKVDDEGLPSQTRWRVLGRGDGLVWLELTPLTGRTHQLRVHCAAMGWPLLGDPIYGGPAEAGHMPDQGQIPPCPEPLHLLARGIVVPLYATKDPIRIEAPVPAHMRVMLSALGHGS